jgi:hypothetical protein
MRTLCPGTVDDDFRPNWEIRIAEQMGQRNVEKVLGGAHRAFRGANGSMSARQEGGKQLAIAQRTSPASTC